MSTTPARAAAATISRPSVTEKHIGFSTRTCRPASAAAIAIGAWLPEVATSTASIGSAIRSRQSVHATGIPYRCAHALALSAAMSQTARTSYSSDSSAR